MNVQRLLRVEWDVIAGILAAIVAMLLSFMGIASETIVRGIILLLCALLLIRDLRSESRLHRLFEIVDLLRRHLASVQDAVKGPEVKLVGPKKLRQETTAFSEALYGEVLWFNFCSRMFRRQEMFDAILRPIFENPHVTSVRINCRPEERPFWEADVLPKLQACEGRTKLHGPFWGSIRGNVSFILGDVGGDGRNEALVTILDEPFAAANFGPSVPRYALRLLSHCDLVAQIEELSRHVKADFRSDPEAAAEKAAHLPQRDG